MSDGQHHSGFRPPPELVAAEQQLAGTDEAGVRYVDLPRVACTEASYGRFGRIFRSWTDYERHLIDKVPWPTPCQRPVVGGKGGGTTGSNPMIINWDARGHCMFRNLGLPNGDYDLGYRKNGHIYGPLSNAHEDGEQIFWPMSARPFWCILSSYGDEATLKPSDFVAFWMDGTFGFSVFAGVQHNPLYPTQHDKVKMLTTQGKVHANVLFEPVAEFGIYLRIPDAFAEPPTATRLPDRFNRPPHVPDESPAAANGETAAAATHVARLPALFVRKPVHISPAIAGLLTGCVFLNPYICYGQLVSARQAANMNVNIERWPAKTRPMDCGDEQGSERLRHTIDVAPDGTMSTGQGSIYAWRTDKGAAVKQLWARPDGECLIEVEAGDDGEDWVIVLAQPDAHSLEPRRDTLMAVRLSPNSALCLKRLTWHSPPLLAGAGAHSYSVTGNACDAWLSIDVEAEAGAPIALAGLICD